MRQSRAIRWALGAAVALHLALGARTLATIAQKRVGDYDRFLEIARSQGRPYLDYQVEYPPGTLFAFKAIATIAPTRSSFRSALVLLDIAADLAIMATLAWAWGPLEALFFAAVTLPIPMLLFTRVDLWSVAAVTAGVAACRRQRRLAGGTLLAIGSSLKVWPVPFFLLLRPPTRWSKPTWTMLFIVLLLAAGATWWATGGWQGLHQVLTFRSASGWQIESSVGSVLYTLDPSAVRAESGAFRIGAVSPNLSLLLFAIGGPLYLANLWRGVARGQLGLGWLAGVGTLLVASPLLSPQFLLWLAPAAAIAWVAGDGRRPAALLLLAILITAGYRWHMVPAAVLVRNLVLLALVLDATVSIWKRRGSARARNG